MPKPFLLVDLKSHLWILPEFIRTTSKGNLESYHLIFSYLISLGLQCWLLSIRKRICNLDIKILGKSTSCGR